MRGGRWRKGNAGEGEIVRAAGWAVVIVSEI